MRAKVHRFFDTKGKTLEDKKVIKDEIHSIILKQLEDYSK